MCNYRPRLYFTTIDIFNMTCTARCGRSIFYPNDGFWNKVIRIFSSKKPTKFGPFRTKFSKVLTKNKPFGFHFSKGASKNLVRIPVILSGGMWIKNRTSQRHIGTSNLFM